MGLLYGRDAERHIVKMAYATAKIFLIILFFETIVSLIEKTGKVKKAKETTDTYGTS